MNQTHEEKVAMATEVGRLLPETKDKVVHYQEVIDSEQSLIDEFEKRQSKLFVSKINKAKEKVEIVRLKNSILQKVKVFKSYLKRKKEYEKWLDEMAIEVNANFEETIKEARDIPYGVNPRLQDGITKFETFEDNNTLQDTVEFYLFVKQEILNHKTAQKRNK